jgi:hypothetical protein
MAGRRRKTAIAEAENNRQMRVLRADFTFKGNYDFDWIVELDDADSNACRTRLTNLWQWFNSNFGNVQYNPGANPPQPRIIDIT